MTPTLSIVVCAAGIGSRAGFDKNKLLVPYEGDCALSKLLAKLRFEGVDEIVLSIHPQDEEEIVQICAPYEPVKKVYGGATRSQSVYNALRQVTGEVVLIHDGARPYITKKIIEQCYQSVLAFGSGICAVPSVDTVALADNASVESVPDRNRCYLVQTPQGFFTKDIKGAYEKAFAAGDTQFTDDSSLYGKYVGKPRLCLGDKKNVKLTFAEDFLSPARVGFGVDTHAFGKEQDFIVLGGVKVPSESGLIAHSDGDVLLHAVMDALLSAVGLKDIGHYFPDTDPRYQGADSARLTEEVVKLVEDKGYCVHNISVAVQAEKPRLARYIDGMRQRLADLLHIDEEDVGVTAGTNEGLGYVGEGKGITVYAYVSLQAKRSNYGD